MGWKKDATAALQRASARWDERTSDELAMAVVDAYSAVDTAVRNFLQEQNQLVERNIPLHEVLKSYNNALGFDQHTTFSLNLFQFVRNKIAHEGSRPHRRLIRDLIDAARQCMLVLGVDVSSVPALKAELELTVSASSSTATEQDGQVGMPGAVESDAIVRFLSNVAEEWAFHETIDGVNLEHVAKLPYRERFVLSVRLYKEFVERRRVRLRELSEARIMFLKLLTGEVQSESALATLRPVFGEDARLLVEPKDILRIDVAHALDLISDDEFVRLRSLTQNPTALRTEARKLSA